MYSWTAQANMLIEELAWSAPPCFHQQTVPVHLSTGELVAQICLLCDEQLGAGFMQRYDHEKKYYR